MNLKRLIAALQDFYSEWHAILLAFVDKHFGPLIACVIIFKNNTPG